MPYSKETITRRAIRQYAKGRRLGEIAAEYGLNRATLASRLKAAGVTMRGRAPADVQRLDGKIIEKLYISGASANKIAKTLGVSHAAVNAKLRKLGVPKRSRSEQLLISRGGTTAESRQVIAEQAADLYGRKWTTKEIAAELKIGVQTIHKILGQMGVKKRAPGADLRKKISTDDILERYEEGESILSLSKIFGVSRGLITSRLREAGASLRSMSAQVCLENAKLTEGQRKARTAKANAHVRGQKVRLGLRIASAGARQIRGSQTSKEKIFSDCLLEIGVVTVPQYSVNQHSIDLAVPDARLAIEVKSHWSYHGRKGQKEQEKREHLEALDWIVFDATGTAWRSEWGEKIVEIIKSAARKNYDRKSSVILSVASANIRI